MGSDGTLGLQAIKAQGGAGPGAAARVGAVRLHAAAARSPPGCADIVAPPAELPGAASSRAGRAARRRRRHRAAAGDGSRRRCDTHPRAAARAQQARLLALQDAAR
ncbi:MAG: hypothetical protein MZW92_65800 [Comamonadaceae bacterium]|nr:hypothetical protein [Comamonadaceae bacterium]